MLAFSSTSTHLVQPKRYSLLIISTALLLLLFAWQSVILSSVSAGGGIQVIETKAIVAFPGEVELTVTAESEEEIIEVQVFYRPTGGNIWSYAYADFKSDMKITATQVLPANSVSYLAPGVEIEYYFKIRDTEGNILTSERAVVEYLDHRFDWERTQIGPLTLVYYDQSESRVDAVAEEIQQDLNRILRLLQLEPSRNLKGVIYKRGTDAQEAFPEQSRTTKEGGIFGGFAFSEQGVFIGQGLDRRIIAHESAHLLFSQALGERSPSIPAWLEEGIASYFEHGNGTASGRSLRSRSLPLRAMTSVSGTPRDIGIFYDKAESILTYLIDGYGEDKFRQFIVELSGGRQVESSLRAVYGFDINGLDARWAASYVDTTPPMAPTDTPDSPGSPAPFIFFSNWLIVVVALAVIVGLTSRWLNRKLRSTRNLEGYPEYDDCTH